jgi:hypothetical protein
MSDSGEHDFDFLIGHWRVSHRRLRERLKGSDEWQEFEGHCAMHTTLGGFGNVDDNLLHLPTGPYRAVGVRAFDRASRRWSIWWLDERDLRRLDPPVIGSFESGVGSFYAEDEHEGRPIRVRFRWTETGSGAPRWEQAFSVDGGQSWETNWTMRFQRVPAP